MGAGRALEVAVVGLGSNLLVADSGWDGMVVKLRGELTAVERDGERWCAVAAHRWRWW